MPKYNYERYGKQSLSYDGAKLWNMLGNDVKTSIHFKDFNRLVSSWDGLNNNCSYFHICVWSNM